MYILYAYGLFVKIIFMWDIKTPIYFSSFDPRLGFLTRSTLYRLDLEIFTE